VNILGWVLGCSNYITYHLSLFTYNWRMFNKSVWEWAIGQPGGLRRLSIARRSAIGG
jgi:hypothetical protein